MSENEDRTLFLDLLRPYRKAVSSNSPKASVSSAAAKLNFTDSSINEGFNNPTPKRLRVDSDSNGNSSVPSSPWEVRRLKGELTEAHAQITHLESQISQQHNVRKEMEVLFDAERRGLIEDRKSRERAAAELGERIKVLREREMQSRDEISRLNKKIAEMTYTFDIDKQQMSREISELRVKVIEATYSGNEQLAGMKENIEKLTQSLEASQKEVEYYKAGHEKAMAEAEKASKLQVELDTQSVALKKAEQRLSELEYDKESYNVWLQQAKASQQRLAAMPGMERDLANLRSEVRNLRSTAHQCQLLEEQVHVLETKLNSLQPVHKDLQVVQAKCSDVEKELEEWRTLARKLEVCQPGTLNEMVEKLQERELMLTSQKVDTDSQLARTKDELITAVHERDKATTKLTDLQNIQKTQQSLIHRIQKKLLLVSRERDSYRHQLDCYEKELTLTLGHGQGGHNMGTGALGASRIDGLEKALQGYRDLVAKMEQDMSVLKADVSPAIQEQVSRLKEEVSNLRMDNQKLRSRKNELEVQLEQHAIKESETIKTKLVHMTKNPFTMLQDNLKSELDKAQAEIIKLRKKLEANELELTQRLSETLNPTAEIQQLKSELESSKLMYKRLKEVLTSSIDEYRNAFYMLLGYTMDRISPNNYKLTNVFAESENDYLAFKITDEGEIDMIQTDYATQISDLVELYLYRQKSIPVFLSTLTLNLFNKTTMVQDSTMQVTVTQ